MTSSLLRFAPYRESARVPNIVVDGSPNDQTVLTLSHWPGLASPPGCEADTSTQMVFRYLDRGADLHAGAQVVTNNHFDQDGLAGVYALVQPQDALRHRELLEGFAAAGDFAVAADRSAARLSMAVFTLADPERSPIDDVPEDHDEACAIRYRTALDLLPAWLEDPERCRTLWEEEDAELDAGLVAVRSGAVTIEEDASLDLAVVTLPTTGRSAGHRFTGRRFGGVHPIALHGATEQTVILTIDPAGGRHRVTCRYEGWVQYRSRAIRARVDLRPLADRLTEDEADGARWLATPPEDLTPELYTDATAPSSSLDPPELIRALSEHLRTAPPAWNPYPAPAL